MNQAKLNEMIEQATPQEKRQMKACINVHLNTLQEKMCRERAEAERMLESGISETEIALKQEREQNAECK